MSFVVIDTGHYERQNQPTLSTRDPHMRSPMETMMKSPLNLGDLNPLGIVGQRHDDGTIVLQIPGLDSGVLDLKGAGGRHLQQVLPVQSGDVLYVTVRVTQFVHISNAEHDAITDAILALTSARFPGMLRVIEVGDGKAQIMAVTSVATQVQQFLSQQYTLCSGQQGA